jgi:hypothetical protein
MQILQRILVVAALAGAALLLIAASENSVTLTAHEEHLAGQIGFKKEVLKRVKIEIDAPIHRLSGYDESGYQIMVNGVVVSLPRSRSETVRSSLKAKLAPLGYLVFFVEMNDRIKRDRLGIIKGTDQFDILGVMQTNGESDDLSHGEIIEQLRDWERQYPFEIIGAENDWVELEFKTVPKDLISFAEEVYDFCPAVVDEGAGTVKELANQLKASRRLLLWWY